MYKLINGEMIKQDNPKKPTVDNMRTLQNQVDELKALLANSVILSEMTDSELSEYSKSIKIDIKGKSRKDIIKEISALPEN